MLTRMRVAVALLAAALVAVAAATALVVFRPPPGTRVTALFTEAIGVYAGSDVRVLGVKVGTIDTVRAEGTRVRVTLTVDHGVDVPAGARAVAVAPSLVSDRYIQLAPAYTGGARLASGTVIPVERTATPMELDKVYASIKKLAADLGPNGLNQKGALSDVLGTGADNLRGNGQALRTTIERFGQAAKTLTGSQDDLFATIDNLQKFTTMIKENDGQVRLAEQQLAEVTGFLAADRQELGGALTALADALGRVERFVRDNRALLKDNVGKLADITRTLVDQRRSLAEVLDVQPLNAGNLLNAYDPATRTLQGRGDLNEIGLPLPAAGTVGTGRGTGQ
ncbi:MCE family protein [Actinomadura hibisca]|uniref:MCE family protein n=1 Tax=Actinomadura hibisca TaxID=68565 RepID=UPI00083344FD|nr:MCE family protein [Actinomadura hibisca]